MADAPRDLGEEVSEILDYVPGHWKVSGGRLRIRRPHTDSAPYLDGLKRGTVVAGNFSRAA